MAPLFRRGVQQLYDDRIAEDERDYLAVWWQEQLEKKSIKEIETGLARSLYGPASEWKAKMAVNALQAKKGELTQYGEVALPKDKIRALKREANDKATTHRLTKWSLIVAGVVGAAGWGSFVLSLVRWMSTAPTPGR